MDGHREKAGSRGPSIPFQLRDTDRCGRSTWRRPRLTTATRFTKIFLLHPHPQQAPRSLALAMRRREIRFHPSIKLINDDGTRAGEICWWPQISKTRARAPHSVRPALLPTCGPRGTRAWELGRGVLAPSWPRACLVPHCLPPGAGACETASEIRRRCMRPSVRDRAPHRTPR